MKIGVIGAGNVGGTLGSRWARNGHEVWFSSRNPESDEMKQLLAKAGGTARACSANDAAKAGDVVLLATPWEATRQILEGLSGLTGKTVIDATNPVLPNLAGLQIGTTTSAAEQVAQWAGGAKVVKAFNTVGFNVMANPGFGGDRAVLFYCGDDTGAKSVTKQLAEELGFEALDAGPLTQARVLEPFALLWISLAVFHGYGRDFAFKFLRR